MRGGEDQSPSGNVFLPGNLYPTDSGRRANKDLIAFADLVVQKQLWTTAEKLSRSAGLELHEI